MNKTILVVDDSASVRQQVTLALRQSGFTAVEAADGEQAQSMLAQHEISLVISDINMPVMNGLELLESIKAEPAHQSLPVLMLTTEDATELIQRAKALGAKGWIIKPFKAELLVAAVKKLTA